MTTATPSPTLRALLGGLVDYAGLFPPAALPMGEAVASYASYLDGADSWALGRFVVPVARLDELAAEAAGYAGARTPWRVSALAGDDPGAGATGIREFNATHLGRLLVDTVELRASSAESIGPAVGAFGPDLTSYVELPVKDDPRPLLAAVKAAGARAKVRTGGTTADAFPSAAQLARFIARCAELGVPFKATAGLHHPLRGEQRLSYAPDAASATMFGFLNVFLAAAWSRHGMREEELAALLEERQATAIEFGRDAVCWRGHALPLNRLSETRASHALAFGSCSFREPIDDLHHLSLL